jgi:hypothetical protein
LAHISNIWFFQFSGLEPTLLSAAIFWFYSAMGWIITVEISAHLIAPEIGIFQFSGEYIGKIRKEPSLRTILPQRYRPKV